MSEVAIKIENLGKLYRLGEIGTGTISHDLNRWFSRLRGKEDPFIKVTETNDRTKKGESNYVWALKDISFDVNQGEVLGIIGRNGAGKSTLLKILSKVTTPSHGRIKINGRIASLLEVGTGFHPELTGRENIFLNGAILGMTKTEIRKKFDEIVDFAGVERYIDTPVKRYSSGMYVRLAFAVAAFLEPEILIVDEVLAVGDAEFQKKCLGRIKDVSKNNGRTVLFVSHNLSAIKAICNTGILLKNGSLTGSGIIDEVIKDYSIIHIKNDEDQTYRINNLSSDVKVNELIINGQRSGAITLNDVSNLSIQVQVDVKKELVFELELHIKKGDELVCSFADFIQKNEYKKLNPGNHNLNYEIQLPLLMNGIYTLEANFTHPMVRGYSILKSPIAIEILNSRLHSYFTNQLGNWSKVLLNGIN